MAGAAAQESGVAAPAPVQGKVIYDRGTHLVVLPMHIPVGRVVEVGEPRNIRATVVKHEIDGLSVCEVDEEFLPRRAYTACDWLPKQMHGEIGPVLPIQGPES